MRQLIVCHLGPSNIPAMLAAYECTSGRAEALADRIARDQPDELREHEQRDDTLALIERLAQEVGAKPQGNWRSNVAAADLASKSKTYDHLRNALVLESLSRRARVCAHYPVWRGVRVPRFATTVYLNDNNDTDALFERLIHEPQNDPRWRVSKAFRQVTLWTDDLAAATMLRLQYDDAKTSPWLLPIR